MLNAWKYYYYLYSMSKRELKKYAKQLTKKQLEEQLVDLYERFKDVKSYYDFAFNPKEDKLLEDCKFRISKEYFPVSKRKPKARRSVAQKFIKHFKLLGVDAHIIADVMLYNIEIAQTYSASKLIKQDSFFLSMLKSYNEAVTYIIDNGLTREFKPRLEAIAKETWKRNWLNKIAFDKAYDLIIDNNI